MHPSPWRKAKHSVHEKTGNFDNKLVKKHVEATLLTKIGINYEAKYVYLMALGVGIFP